MPVAQSLDDRAGGDQLLSLHDRHGKAGQVKERLPTCNNDMHAPTCRAGGMSIFWQLLLSADQSLRMQQEERDERAQEAARQLLSKNTRQRDRAFIRMSVCRLL